jgi:hypothetical protein
VDRRVASEAGPAPGPPRDALDPGADRLFSDQSWGCCLIFLLPFIFYVFVLLLAYLSGFHG